MKKAIKVLVLTAAFALSAQSAFAGGGGLSGGATEWTQQMNNSELISVASNTSQTAYHALQSFNKQVQMYATQLQQYAEALKTNFSVPFQIAKDLKNSVTGIYGTLRGAGEGVFSYTNASNWMSDITNRTGYLERNSYAQKTTETVYQVADDIMTRGESEAALAKDAEKASNAATGSTAAIQANTQAALVGVAAQQDTNTLLAAWLKKEASKEKEQQLADKAAYEEWKKSNEKILNKEY